MTRVAAWATLAATKEAEMQRRVTHLVRDAAIVATCYAALIAVAWIALGLGGAVIAAVGAGALIALFLPFVFVYEEEQELLHPRGRTQR